MKNSTYSWIKLGEQVNTNDNFSLAHGREESTLIYRLTFYLWGDILKFGLQNYKKANTNPNGNLI